MSDIEPTTEKDRKALSNQFMVGGKLYGLVPIPNELQVPVGLLKGFVEDQATRGFGEKVTEWTGNTQYGNIASNLLPIMFKFSPVFTSVSGYFGAVKNLNTKLAPFLDACRDDNAGLAGIFSSEADDNRVVQFARDQVHKVHRNGLTGNLIKAGIGYGGQLYNNNYRIGQAEEAIASGNARAKASEVDVPKLVAATSEGVAQYIETKFGDQVPKIYSQKGSSLDKCLQFKKEMDDRLPSLKMLDAQAMRKEQKHFAAMAREILERVYLESGWKKMPEHVHDDIDAVCAAMVLPMLEGRLDPIAIISLAGQDKVLLRDGSGIVEADELETVLEKAMEKFSPARVTKTKDYFADPRTNFQLADVAARLKDLSPDEKAFFASVFSDDLLIKAGAKKSDVADWRKQFGQMDFESYEECIFAVAYAPEKETREMLNKKEREHFAEAAKQIEAAAPGEERESVVKRIISYGQTQHALANLMTRGEAGSYRELIEAQRKRREGGQEADDLGAEEDAPKKSSKFAGREAEQAEKKPWGARTKKPEHATGNQVEI